VPGLQQLRRDEGLLPGRHGQDEAAPPPDASPELILSTTTRIHGVTGTALRPCRFLFLLAAPLLLWTPAGAESVPIDTGFIEKPWPKQRERELEVGRHPVRWRDRVHKKEGLFAGARYVAPVPSEEAWRLATEYHDLGTELPGVTAMRTIEQSERRDVIEFDLKVLWKQLTIRFEIERDPGRALRFRMLNQAIGEYRGVCLFEPAEGGSGTTMELSTWLKPARPVPLGMLLIAERMVMLRGVRDFLEQAERHGPAR
jgi:hypothetical protein